MNFYYSLIFKSKNNYLNYIIYNIKTFFSWRPKFCMNCISYIISRYVFFNIWGFFGCISVVFWEVLGGPGDFRTVWRMKGKVSSNFHPKSTGGCRSMTNKPKKLTTKKLTTTKIWVYWICYLVHLTGFGFQRMDF